MTGPVRVTGTYTPGPVRVVGNQVIPPGGGSGEYNVDAPIPIGGYRIGVVPGERIVGFDGVAASVIEGNTLTVRAKVTRRNAVDTLAMPIAVAAGSTTDPAAYTLPAEFVWAPGQKFAEVQIPFSGTAAAGATTALNLELAPHVAPSDPDYVIPRVDSAFLPSSFAITVTDFVFGVPSFSFAAATLAVNEGDTVPVTVDLTAPAGSPITLRVYTEAITAQEFQDFEPLDELIEIAAGEVGGQVELVCPQNNVDESSDPTVRLHVELVSGTANPGTHVATVVSIIDDDDSTIGVPRVAFRSAQRSALEGAGPITITAEARTSGGTLVGFATRTEIPVVASGNVDTGDFNVTWPGTVSRLVFEAGSPTATFQVEALDDGEPDDGDSIAFTIQGDAALQWITGTVNTVTVVATEATAEPTELFHEAIASSDGVQVLRQFTVAVDPPSLTVPVYEVGGQQAQVVGQRRNAAGEWTQAYVYALDDGSSSTPQHAALSATELTRVTGAPAPSAIHLDDAEVPRIQFTLKYGNGAPGTVFTCATDEPQSVIDWTSPTGKFRQVGADVCRERVFVWRPRLVGGSGASHLSGPSGEFLGKIDLVEQRIAGERDIVLYEGRFYNGAWEANQDQRAENPFCDGTINLHSVAAIGPSGGTWKMEVFDAHPYQDRGGLGDRAFDVLKFAGHDYEILPGKAFHFWFVMRRVDGTEAADSAARAEHYWECRHISTAWGGLGIDRHGLSGEKGEPDLNYARAEYVDTRAGQLGFDGIRRVAQEQMGGVSGHNAGYRADWVNGSRGPDGWDNRLGWFMPMLDPRGGGTGGDGVIGSHNVLPAYSSWYRSRIHLCAIAGREINAFRDINSDDACWWWRTAEFRDGAWRVGMQGHINAQYARVNHWHLVGPWEPTSQTYDRNFAPTTRPWNTAPSGLEDPFASEVDGYEPFPWTHQTRVRRGYLDGWIHRRSPLALRVWEENAARASRAFNPTLPFLDDYGRYDVGQSNLARGKEFRIGDGSDVGKGYYYERTNYQPIRNATPRSWGWGMLCVGGYYSFAVDSHRESMRGAGVAAARGGADLVGELLGFCEHIATPAGITFAAVNTSDTVPWNDNKLGPSQPSTHTGSLPGMHVVGSGSDPDYSVLDPNEAKAYGSKWFMQVFITRGIACLLKHCAPVYTYDARFYEQLRWAYNHHEAQRSWIGSPSGFPQTQRINEIVITGIDLNYTPTQSDAPSQTYTTAEIRAGANAWPQIRLGETSDLAFGNQYLKSGWLAMDAIEWFQDPSYDSIARYILDREDFTEDALWRSIVEADGGAFDRLSTSSEYYRYKNLGSHTFMTSFAAWLLNQTT